MRFYKFSMSIIVNSPEEGTIPLKVLSKYLRCKLSLFDNLNRGDGVMGYSEKRILTIFIFGLSFLVLSGQISQAHASYGHYKSYHKDYRSYNKNHYNHTYYDSYRPYYRRNSSFVRVNLGFGDSCYYSQGNFYRYRNGSYRNIHAPYGATVRRLPFGYKKVYIHGEPYYSYKETYYTKQPEGYTVVDISREVERADKDYLGAPSETHIVNVPNKNGSYTPVKIKRYGDTYVGPNGEYYNEAPTIDQLKRFYSKS